MAQSVTVPYDDSATRGGEEAIIKRLDKIEIGHTTILNWIYKKRITR